MRRICSRTRTAALIAAMGVAAVGPAHAASPDLALNLPSHALTTTESFETLGSYAMPVGPWIKGEVASIWAEGPISRRALRLDGTRLESLQVLAPLRRQLQDAGFEVLYECKTRQCGGFDFRFSTEVLPEPDMHVDLGDYRFLAAQRSTGERPEYVSLLISRSAGSAFVQIIEVGTNAMKPAGATKSTKSVAGTIESTTRIGEAGAKPSGPAIAPDSLAARLETGGTAILGDLMFATGTASLSEGDYPSLNALAAYLRADPARRAVLVGHTDAQGSQQANAALSKRRAGSVVERLVALGVSRQQVSADGVGFLSPVASNLTEEGRRKNRRVEVILTSTR